MKKLSKLLDRITGMKLYYRMLLVYIFGGALPIILIALYLVQGISEILVEQAEREEAIELEMIRRQAEEIFSTVSTVTKYFYFDPQLEEIAGKQYRDYQEVVNDYKAYTGFQDYTRYHNRIIGWVNIYMENDTLTENSRFEKVTEQMEQEEWYATTKARNGSAVWRYRSIPAVNQNALSMLRMLKTAKGEDVGILAVYIRPERFETLLGGRDCDALVLLNGETVVTDMADEIEPEDIAEFLPTGTDSHVQKSITIGKSKYLMTCESISLMESEDTLQIVSLRAYADILSAVNRQNAKSIIIFIVSVMTSVSIILVFSRSFSRRVERFRVQMHRAAQGNFELEENIGGNDEIASLYDYLGTMIGEIQRLLAEIYQEKLHADRLTIQQKDAEFKMLASQINPHFLYNTLETIRMKARKSGQKDIEEIVKMLAKIMRSYIQISDTDTSLRKEIELVECYLKIQQYRFGERIQYHIHVEPELEEYRILPLVVQPIVENSIIHGLESKEGAGNVSINACVVEGKAVISIEDDGLGISAAQLETMRQRLNRYDRQGHHIGVANVHQRVRLKYGEEYGVTIESVENQYTKVTIVLPVQEAE
ncbi:MAG: sensor histidine kinase [Lachnospiraceae bacterium]|nr:sensor histidine kinase [Lachnospiraceae bacterium]